MSLFSTELMFDAADLAFRDDMARQASCCAGSTPLGPFRTYGRCNAITVALLNILALPPIRLRGNVLVV